MSGDSEPPVGGVERPDEVALAAAAFAVASPAPGADLTAPV